jgi:hypothetical protein
VFVSAPLAFRADLNDTALLPFVDGRQAAWLEQKRRGVIPSGPRWPSSVQSEPFWRAAAFELIFPIAAPHDAGGALLYHHHQQDPVHICPGHLYSPAYSDPVKTLNHRTYETILPLSLRLGLTINNDYQEGQEAQLASAIAANDAGISLVAWEHDHIPDIAANIPVVSGVVVPAPWPGDRFDLIWCFTLAAGNTPAYHFAALPELLLFGRRPRLSP